MPVLRGADVIAQFVRGLGIRHVFGVCGGGSMFLNDAFHDLFVAMQHEQAAAFAADAYARMNGIGCCLVTTGPGGTNAITGCAASFIDHIPVIFISGQVTSDTLKHEGERQRGMQEVDIVSLVRPVTKFARTVMHTPALRPALRLAHELAIAAPSGPVWIDVPLDTQGGAHV